LKAIKDQCGELLSAGVHASHTEILLVEGCYVSDVYDALEEYVADWRINMLSLEDGNCGL
jgi:hypothetical protein